jgi:sec-independent protein translocase protein TatA
LCFPYTLFLLFSFAAKVVFSAAGGWGYVFVLIFGALLVVKTIKTLVMCCLMFLGNLGAPEIILIALIVLLLFGGKKIPELMRGIGKGVKNFKDGVKGIEEEIKLDDSVSDRKD